MQLQTQAGDYKIDKIADMAEVGTVWFYTNGIINILSQHRMATLSKWNIDYITRNYKVLGDIDDLSYKVTTEEGIKCKFCPMPKGLYVYNVLPRNTSQAFGKKIVDNLTDMGKDMCYIGHVDSVKYSLVFTGVTENDIGQEGANNIGVINSIIEELAI